MAFLGWWTHHPISARVVTWPSPWCQVSLSFLCLAALYVLTDIFKVRKGTGPLLLFGTCSLFVWEVAVFGYPVVRALATRLGEGLPNLFGDGVHRLVWIGMCEMAVIAVSAVLWYRFKTKKD